jgi:hypothetical protein
MPITKSEIVKDINFASAATMRKNRVVDGNGSDKLKRETRPMEPKNAAASVVTATPLKKGTHISLEELFAAASLGGTGTSAATSTPQPSATSKIAATGQQEQQRPRSRPIQPSANANDVLSLLKRSAAIGRSPNHPAPSAPPTQKSSAMPSVRPTDHHHHQQARTSEKQTLPLAATGTVRAPDARDAAIVNEEGQSQQTTKVAYSTKHKQLLLTPSLRWQPEKK